MTDSKKFNEIIKRHESKVYEVAVALGMSPQTLYNKLNNSTEFSQTEMAKFRNLFPDVTDDEFKAIFFAEQLSAEVNE